NRTILGPYARRRLPSDAMIKGDARVAAIDGYALDRMRRHDPSAAAQVRVADTTAPAPSPPLVASPSMPAAACERLVETLATAHRSAGARPLLDDVLLARFDRVTSADFDVFL